MKLSSYCSHDLKMGMFYRGHAQLIFVSPAKQKRDICTAFPAAASASSAASTFLYLGHFLGNYKG